MASSGTLLSDLSEGGAPMASGDNDLVKKIFADMNMGSQANPIMNSSGSGGMIMAPNPNTIQPMVMDNVPATSHIIGKDHPTPGDFAAAMHGVPRAEVAGMVPPPMPANGMMPQGQFASYMGQPQQPQMMMPQVPQKNIYARVAEELKTPILVSILVFVFSLPFLNILFSHYAPMLLKPTGDLTSIGLLVKAVAAGGAFWVLQRVIAPLVSL
jgi:hypothetical protein